MLSRYSIKPKLNKAAVVAPNVQRHAISADVSDGRRKAARKPSIVGDGEDIQDASGLGYRTSLKTAFRL
jgi:hypothetical protein